MAVSLDADIFQEAEREAEQMRVSVPELCAMAIQEFTRNRHKSAITKQLDEVYASNRALIDEDILQVQYDLLPEEDW